MSKLCNLYENKYNYIICEFYVCVYLFILYTYLYTYIGPVKRPYPGDECLEHIAVLRRNTRVHVGKNCKWQRTVIKIFTTFQNLESESLNKFSEQLLPVRIYYLKWLPGKESV